MSSIHFDTKNYKRSQKIGVAWCIMTGNKAEFQSLDKLKAKNNEIKINSGYNPKRSAYLATV